MEDGARAWSSGGAGEGEELLVVPLAGGDEAALGVGEEGVVLGAQEVGDGVAVLGVVVGDDAVDARLHRVARGEAQRVADVMTAVPGRGSTKPNSRAPGGRICIPHSSLNSSVSELMSVCFWCPMLVSVRGSDGM